MNVGTLEIQMMANLARLQQDMDRATSIVSQGMGNISRFVEIAKSAIGGLLAGMSVGAFASMVKGTIDVAAGLHDMSIQTGASVASLMEFKSIAATSETTVDGIATAMNKLAKNMAVANESSKGTGEVIKSLGIDFRALQAMSPDQQMLTIAVALDKFQDGAGKSAAAMTLFGKEGAKMLPFLADLAASSEELGKTLTEQEIVAKAALGAMADDFMDNLTLIKKNGEAWKKDISFALLPVLDELSAAFLKATSGPSMFRDTIHQLASDGTITQWTRDVVDGLKKVAAAILPAAKVAAAYFAIFVAAPAVVSAVSLALSKLISLLAVYAMNVLIGQTGTLSFNKVLFGTSVSADLAAGSLTRLQLAGNLLFAAYAGWQIGSYLSENFTEARIAGLAFVGVMLTGWENIKYGAQLSWAAIGFVWDTTINAMKLAYAGFLDTVAKGLSFVGANETAAAVTAYSEELRAAAGSQQSFADLTKDMAAAHNQELEAIDKNIVELVQYQLAADGAVKSATALANAPKPALASDPNSDVFNKAYSSLGAEAARLKQAGESLKAYQDAAEHAKRAEIDFETSFGKLKDLAEPQKKALKEMADAVDHFTSRNKLLGESMLFHDAAAKAEREAALIAVSGIAAANDYTDALARQADGKMKNLSATEQAVLIQNAYNKVQAEANKTLATSTDSTKAGNIALQATIASLNADVIASKYSEEQKVRLANATSLASQAYKDQAVAAARAADDVAKVADAQQLGISLADRVKEMNAGMISDDQMRAQAQLKIEVDKYQKQIDLAESAYVELASLNDAANADQLAADRAAIDKTKEALRDYLEAANEQIKFDGIKKAWQDVADTMTSAFGEVGKTMGQVFQAYGKGVEAQIRAQRDLAEARKKSDDDPDKIAAINRAQLNGSLAQIQGYVGMTAAAQGFFSEGSRGYQAMHAATVALQSAEIALSLIKGVNAVLTQGEGDPYSAFGRMAAMAAIVAGLGVAISGGGGGGGQSAADAQKVQGTGSVFGDSTAKSDSVRRSIEALKDNSDSMLPINQGMLNALNAIESAMTGLTNLVVRTSGLTDGTNMGITEGQLNAKGSATDFVSNFMTHVQYAFAGPIIGGKLASIGNNLWGKVTQEIIDSGIQYSGSLRNLQEGNGFDQYATVNTTKSSWFGLSKKTSSSVQTQGLSDELSNQFGLIFTNLDMALQSASVALGGSAADVTKVLDNLTLESTKVSLKGLTGTALTDALNSVISKSMDEIATAVFPQFESFRQVGEGYAETVLRLAGDYAKLDSILAASSTTFGATGIASVAARERLIALTGGIDELASQSNSFVENFLSKAEQLAPVQKYVTDQLAAMGLQGIDTRDKFKDVVLGLANSGALATEAGATQYAALLALADAFAKTHAATVDLTKSEQEIADERKDLQSQLDELTLSTVQLAEKARAAIDPYNLALYDQVQAARAAAAAQEALTTAQEATAAAQSNLLAAYNKQKSALQSIVDLQNAAADATQKQMDALKLGSLSNLSPEQKYLEAQRQFDEAATGDAKNAAAQSLLQASRDYNGSTDAYQRDYAKVQSILALQVASQRSAATVAMQQLSALDDQVGELIDINAGVSTLNSTMLDLQKAILELGSAMMAQAAAAAAAGHPASGASNQGLQAITGVVENLYSTLLGRHSEQAGLDFWVNQVASGQINYDQLVAGFTGSDEYLAIHGSHANGLDYVPFDGYRAELHRGERVQTAAEVVSGEKNGAEAVSLLQQVVTELRADKTQRVAAVEATVSGIVKELKSLKTATKQSAARASAETTA